MNDRPWKDNPNWPNWIYTDHTVPYGLPGIPTGLPKVPTGPWTLPAPTNEPLDEMRRTIERLAGQTGDTSTEDRLSRIEGMLEHLLFLLSLSPQERAFLQAIAEGDEVALLVYADWLEDQGRDKDAKQIRKVAIKRAKKKKPQSAATKG